MAHLIGGPHDIIISPELDRCLIFRHGTKKTMILPQAAYDELDACVQNGSKEHDIQAWEQRWKPMSLPVPPLSFPQPAKPN